MRWMSRRDRGLKRSWSREVKLPYSKTGGCVDVKTCVSSTFSHDLDLVNMIRSSACCSTEIVQHFTGKNSFLFNVYSNLWNLRQKLTTKLCRKIRELHLENQDLKSALNEHQDALEIIMNKYRAQVCYSLKYLPVKMFLVFLENPKILTSRALQILYEKA